MKTTYLLLAALLIAGCSEYKPAATITREYVVYSVGGILVKSFQLSDGTRCMLYTAHNITCEWQTPVVLVPRPQ